MNVLMLTPYLPYPPVSGGRMRTYNLVKQLSVDHTITLVCFGRPEERAFDLSEMQALCELIVVDREGSPSMAKAALLSLTSPRPITMRLYRNDAMVNAVARLIAERQFDVIHVESFYMMQNLPPDCPVPVLLSEPAIEWIAWQRHAGVAKPWFTRPAIALEALKMRVFEPQTWREADLVGVMSVVDENIVKRVSPSSGTFYAPNGVDVAFFTPNPAVQRDHRTAVYMGDYKYFPNTDAVLYFVEAILPLIREKRPDFHLTLLGKDPPPAIQALAGEHITVTGLVDDTRPYLQGSALFVCPLRSGSGTRFKLLEALACGCPVVSTSLGCEGLGAADEKHMLIRDEPQAFADAVVTLLADPARGAQIGAQGRAWVAEKHAWEHSASLLRAAYRQLARKA